jgi:YHS domain-containing protein
MRTPWARRAAAVLAVILSSAWGASAAFAKGPVNTTLFGNKAVHGYDVVAYFEDGKPVPGVTEYSFTWSGARWLFASAAHRDLFAAHPESYAPQYGGYCAYAVAKGDLVDIDPAAFTIVDGKLYLNYSLDIQKKWSLDIPGYVKKADANWPGLSR